MLKNHESYVKGIAWDPAGSFLASQSDDRSVIIWRCSDWTCVQSITEPFHKVTLFHSVMIKEQNHAVRSIGDSYYAMLDAIVSLESLLNSVIAVRGVDSSQKIGATTMAIPHH